MNCDEMDAKLRIENIPDGGPSPAEIVEASEEVEKDEPFARCAQLCRALASLSKSEAWAALQLIAHADQSCTEVARRARVSESSLRRAVARLKAAIRNDSLS